MTRLLLSRPHCTCARPRQLAAFMWTLRNGQYDDLDGAAERILAGWQRQADHRSSANAFPSFD